MYKRLISVEFKVLFQKPTSSTCPERKKAPCVDLAIQNSSIWKAEPLWFDDTICVPFIHNSSFPALLKIIVTIAQDPVTIPGPVVIVFGQDKTYFPAEISKPSIIIQLFPEPSFTSLPVLNIPADVGGLVPSLE